MSPNLLFLLVVQAVLGRSLTAAVGNKLPEQAVSAKMTRLPAIHNNASSSLPPARMREDNIGAPVSCTLAWSLRMKTPALDIRTPTATAGFSGRGETAVNMSPNLLFLLVVQAVLGRSLTAAVGNKLPEQAVSAKMTRLPAIHNNASSSLPPARMREDNIGAPVSCTLAWSLRMKKPALDIRTPTATAGFSGRGETAVNMSPNLLFLLVVQECRRGGVLVAIPTSLTVDRRYDLEHPDLEAIFLELHLPHGTVLLGCVYCPPSTRNSAYQLLDASVTRALLKPYRDILLIGDFNSHIDWWNNDEPVPGDAFDHLLLDATSSAGLFQVCRSTTYLPRNSFLDLVFTTDLTKILCCDVYPGLSGSDHMAVEVSFATSLPRKGHFARTIWSFLETDHAHLASLAHFAPWGMTTMGSDYLSNFDLWCDCACAIQHDSVPHSLRSTRR
ncbi:uncharacterized protein ISCGN_003455 [Ixodes scapularis]